MIPNKKVNPYQFLVLVIALFLTANWHNIIDLLAVNVNSTETSLLYLFMVFATFLLIRRVSFQREKVFRKESFNFYNYFYNWYKADGKLFIFCTDLDWLENDKKNRTFVAICTKGKDASVYLRNVNNPLVAQLKQHKVNIYPIYRNMNCKFRFSINEHNGKQKIILRTIDKKEDGKIRFIETNSDKDPYITSMAKDLLDYCRKR